MITKELLDIIDKINLNLDKNFPNLSENEKLLSHGVKLNEEVGELCSEILKKMGKQRQVKLNMVDDNAIKEEFADVLITTMLLAKYMGIDINEALKLKLDKIENRGGI